MSHSLSKIRPEHLKRRACVYVRQSTPFQVVHHRESTERQYNLRERATALGWPADAIEVIDEDQGRSAASAEHRMGFQRLVSEVGLGRVGVILMLEVSRLARSCSDWHHLVEICSVSRTLIADEAGVYDPREPNDRLLLGVKGTLSEAELFTLRTRLYEGRWNKARRGELGRSIPTGYVAQLDGTWVKDPDAQVRDRLSHVFTLFRRLGVARRVVLALREENLHLPVRVWGGPRANQLDWKEASGAAVVRILRNPAYAGTYAYGQWAYEANRRSAKTGKAAVRAQRVEEWPVCLVGHHEGYISWDEYLANDRRLRSNWFRTRTPGAPREGCALLQGIVWCGRCGARMTVHTYAAREGRRPAYMCARDYQVGTAERTCQNMSSKPVDDAVVTLFLETMTPAQLEIAIKAVDQLRDTKHALKAQREHQIEQARYEALLAQRQYDAVDPDNRLVVAELERRWNQKLEALDELERTFAQDDKRAHFSIDPDEEQAVRALAEDLPSIWNASTTTNQERKQLLRYAISEVQLDGMRTPGEIELRVTWRSGAVTVRNVRRPPVGSWAPRTAGIVIERIRELAPHHNAAEIVEQLNREGLRSAHGKVLKKHHVLYIARRYGARVTSAKRPGGKHLLH